MAAEVSGRSDGRGPEEFRSMFINTGAVPQAKGSAYVEFAATKVMAGVYGPRQAERKFGFSETGRLTVDVRLCAWDAERLGRDAQRALERSMSEAVQTALAASVQLDKIPKSTVDVFVMVLQSGGSDLAVAVTAASVALADAGIELYDLVPACKVVKVGGRLWLDPSGQEEAQREGDALMALLPASSEITQLAMAGRWGKADTREALELCMGACVQLRGAMRDALMQAA
ncbi:hypothetical protein FOA52_000561 [Chlamydomonas sp. UWO 241]|nr:hypothetical protein FOA52_000561 [Chlamydomonas sp. UWO 241]